MMPTVLSRCAHDRARQVQSSGIASSGARRMSSARANAASPQTTPSPAARFRDGASTSRRNSSSAPTPNFSVDAWFGFVAPMGTPVEVVKRLSDEMAKAVQLDTFRKGVEGAGGTVQFQGIAQFDATIRSDIQMFQRVIKAANISAE